VKRFFSELRHVKVVVVGNEAVGKTTLVNQMTDKVIEIDQVSGKGERIVTDGIEMTSLKLSRGMSNTILHLWDFAGQELFYPPTNSSFRLKLSICWCST
jgi:GTPase SAR1 family protein